MKAWHMRAASLRARGYEWKEIARILGKSESAVWGLSRSEEFLREVELNKELLTKMAMERQLQKEDDLIRQRLHGDGPELAVETLFGVMRTGRSEAAKVRAAEAVLDRTGYKPVERVEQTQRIVVGEKGIADLIAALQPLMNKGSEGPDPDGDEQDVDDDDESGAGGAPARGASSDSTEGDG